MQVMEIDYSMSLEFSVPVINHFCILRCIPVSRGSQTVTERKLIVTPQIKLVSNRDIFGNISYRGQLIEPHMHFGFEATATVHVDYEKGSREGCIPLYKYGTELTFATEKMRGFLKSTFAGTDLEEAVIEKKIPRHKVIDFAERLCSSLFNYMEYEPGVTTVKTTAGQAFESRKGVCQDFTHIYCSMCRIAGVAARYVCGASRGEGSTHAWAEVFVPDEIFLQSNGTQIQGRWFGIDPTRNRRCNNDYVILAVGRDYNDCQVDRGIFRGNADQTQTVFVRTRAVELPDYTAPKGMKAQSVMFSPIQPHEQ